MRIYAQTAMIENGFVHLPETATRCFGIGLPLFSDSTCPAIAPQFRR
jgi:hypothetical protein